MEIVAEYDIPDDAWYFDENGADDDAVRGAARSGAAAVRLGGDGGRIDASPSPTTCSSATSTGPGTLHEEIPRTAGTLTTRVKLTSVSRAGGMIIEGFEVECPLGDRRVYTMETVFGFFPPAAFDDQVGLPIADAHRDQLALAGRHRRSTSPCDPTRFCAGDAPARPADCC